MHTGLINTQVHSEKRQIFQELDSWFIRKRPRWLNGKESACQGSRRRRLGFDPWVKNIPWKRKCNPLQYSYLENPMDRGAWRATVHGLTKNQTRLSSWEHRLLLLLLLSRFSRVRLCATPWTAAHQAPWSMGFSRQEYWSGVPLAHTNKQTMPSFTQHIGSTSWETGKVNLKCYWGSENIPRFKNIFLYLLHFWHSAL